MNRRIAAIGIGAVLLLLVAAALPASAAGGGNAPEGNPGNCTDCGEHQYRHRIAASAEASGGGEAEQAMHRYGTERGDCDRQRLRDGSGDRCPRTA
ncbi:MAG: hypothetical protein QMD46_05765 [Methanomicrobiales archaeon]|nr:hypothetical protein [Methanomicrobiales archaeon]MDI6877603.1 hypothetical protein [Methanomicrobiales archaeon]